METLDLRRGGQGLDWAPSPLRDCGPGHPQSGQTSSPSCRPGSQGPQTRAHTPGRHPLKPQTLPPGPGLGRRRQQGPLLPSASDYVCVLDVDLLELVIKTWKGNTEDKLVSVTGTWGPPGSPEPEQVSGRGSPPGITFPHLLSLSFLPRGLGSGHSRWQPSPVVIGPPGSPR